jgi:small-conductance mechanosensitive channel/CRP-like cAMP-binding protein
MLDPPDGWQPHDFWGDLSRDAALHQASLKVAVAMAALLLLGRALLRVEDRKRLRLAVAFFTLFFLCWPIRALFLAAGDLNHYGTIVLTSAVLLVWGIIGVGGLLFFDLIARRVGVPKILRDLTTTVASFIALVTLLSRSGVNLLSIITTSAVLTAVIGLALQDTLGNLMSGIALQLESSIAIGDWIRVDKDGQVGRVREVRWRSTVIETRNADLIIIPNAIVTKSLITNFSKDGLENRRWVYFNVHLRHPPNHVIATVKAALTDIPNVSDKTPPDVVLMDFGESWARYAVRYRLIDFRPDDPTDSAVRTRIWYTLHRASLEMPYPAHNVFVTELDAARDQRKGEAEHRCRLDALKQVHFLAPLDDSERAHLADGLRHEVYGPGEAIIRAGAPGDSLYLMRSGEVLVKIGGNGLEREVATLQAGDFFGEMSLMTGEPRRATVVAKGDAECYVVDRALFQNILQRKESLVGEIGRLLHQREMELKGEQAGLSADAAARAHAQSALLGRIKSFFGLDA